MVTRLVSASGASWGISGLGAGSTLFGLFLLLKHDLETDISTLGVLVEGLTGVLSRSIGGVSLIGLEGVEVSSSSGAVGVPGSVDILLGFVVPKLLIRIKMKKEFCQINHKSNSV